MVHRWYEGVEVQLQRKDFHLFSCAYGLISETLRRTIHGQTKQHVACWECRLSSHLRRRRSGSCEQVEM